MMSLVSNNTFGTLNSAPDNTIINCVYDYVVSILQDFNGTNIENENIITNRLCKALEYKKPAEYSFFFQHQNLEDGKKNTSTDFAAFGTFAYSMMNNIDSGDEAPALIKFEAKRLSTAITPRSREREYVVGEYKNGMLDNNSGGIERFKNGRHGKDVVHTGIVGYLQTNSFKYWLEKVNEWINNEISNPSDSNLSWDKNDLLNISSKNQKVSCYISKSKRISGDFVYFKHFWVNLK